jgi:ABC-type multidrug transport system ATPase subunit
VLIAFAILIYALAALTLHLIRHETKLANARQSETDKSAGKERMTARSPEEVRTIKIQLEDYCLTVHRRSWQGWKWKPQQLHILKPVTATFEPGTLNVVMGPSGSGKTSLLSSMARRLNSDIVSRYEVGGKLLFNGAEPTKPVLQSIVSFVTQDDDSLLPSLTVRETLRFAAGLRLPQWMSKEDKNRRAEEVLLQMGLKDCGNNLIGSDLVKGISGGEKRRVTISIQILTDPRVLLLDEPTSGLDGFTAASIIEVLKGLAEQGRTLVMTIHQSRSDLWPSFGSVLLLARGGHPVYAGPRNHMLKHFASKGFECPQTTNPADFALDLITIDLRHATREAATREKVQSLIDSWDEIAISSRPTSSVIASPAELGSLRKTKATFRTAFPLLLHRSMLNFQRQPPLMIGRIMQVVGLGIILALFFAPLKHDYYSIQSRLGYIQQIVPLYFVGMLCNIAVYPAEQAVFYREHDDRAYDVEAFMLQYTALEIPFEIFASLIFAVLADIAGGLPRTAAVFFIVAFNCFCIVNCGESLGIFFNTLFSHTGFAVNVTAVFLSVAQIMDGTISINIPGFLQAFNHLSPVKYSIQSLAVQAFRGQKFTCLDFQRLPNGRCPQESGEEVLKLYHLDHNLGMSIMALGIVTIAYRLIAYVVLKAKRERWHKMAQRSRSRAA